MRSIIARTKSRACLTCGAAVDTGGVRCLACVRQAGYAALLEAVAAADDGGGTVRLSGRTGACPTCGKRGHFCEDKR